MSDTIFDPAVHATDKDGNPSLNKDGSFRKKRSDSGARSTRSTSRTSKTAAAGSQRARYVDGVRGLLQIPAMGLSLVNPVDGYCVAQHTPPIADAVADLAIERPEVAAALDKVLSVGPYGALIGAVLPLAFQLMHNHNVIPEPMARAMGATPRAEIETHLKLIAERSPEQAAEEDLAKWQREHAAA